MITTNCPIFLIGMPIDPWSLIGVHEAESVRVKFRHDGAAKAYLRRNGMTSEFLLLCTSKPGEYALGFETGRNVTMVEKEQAG